MYPARAITQPRSQTMTANDTQTAQDCTTRDRIRLIIERELSRLDKLSLQQGLDAAEIRSLELLIKAFREFVGENHPATAAQLIPVDELLVGVTDE